jgi:hypothetical protein
MLNIKQEYLNFPAREYQDDSDKEIAIISLKVRIRELIPGSNSIAISLVILVSTEAFFEEIMRFHSGEIIIPSKSIFNDPNRVDKLLGPFRKVVLPIYRGCINMQLINLFPELLTKINQDLIQRSIRDSNRVQVHFAPSGVGKTCVNSVVSCSQFTIFVVCTKSSRKFSDQTAIWDDKT